MLEKLLKGKDVYTIGIPKSHQEIYDTYHKEGHKSYDAIMSFSYTLDEMKNHVFEAIPLLKDQGMLYLCFPKLKNTLNMEGIHRDHIFPKLEVDMDTGYIKDTLMRFNMMRALDGDYSLLGIKKDASLRKRPDVSGRVDDYIKHIDDIKVILKDEACLSFFESLTPGYQKNWARHVFSAKTDETKQRRIKEMIDLLNQGVKTKETMKK
ncbi:MAG: hypothetical protein CVV61_02210 [Tenericutes bacterium HGW-Tenericutes-6]|jgi:hypothetical protein|nr:MAG: hypothetical protein CVV61_02210 [Tenericutes bacterium HGW-Tenericutes-6]